MKVGEICIVSSSKRIFASEYTETGVPFYRGQEITELAKGNKNFKTEHISEERFNELAQKYYIPQANDILITAVGTIGNMYMIEPNHKFYFKDGNIIMLSRFKEDINPFYVFYYLQLPGVIKKIKTTANNSVQKALTIDLMRDIDIVIPKKEVQDKIVSIVKPIYDKIKNNNQIIQELVGAIDDIYRYWFYDCNFPNLSGKPYKENGGIVDRIAGRNVPRNWELKPINSSKLAKPIKPGIYYFDGKKKYLSTSEVDNLNYDTNQNEIDYYNRETRADMQPTNSSVWFAKMKKSIKHIAFTNQSNLVDKVILSTGFYGLQCYEESFEYVWAFINSEWFELKKDAIASGSTQESVSDTTLAYVNILEPDDRVLKIFHEKTHDILNRVYSTLEENDRLINLKDDLVYLLVNDYLEI